MNAPYQLITQRKTLEFKISFIFNKALGVAILLPSSYDLSFPISYSLGTVL
jgi:hypothetical protein